MNALAAQNMGGPGIRIGDRMSVMLAVHILDDDTAVANSLRVLLEAAGFATQTHTSSTAFLAASPELSGCVLTDVRTPGMDGLGLQRQLNESGIPVVVMSGQADIPMAVCAMKAGAVDFLEKPLVDVRVIDAVQRALDISRHQHEARATQAQARLRLSSLTPREREVLNILIVGKPNKAIANELHTSPRTIEVHRARILRKLGVDSLPGLVRLTLAAQNARVQPP